MKKIVKLLLLIAIAFCILMTFAACDLNNVGTVTHKYETWTIIKAPTCTEAGEQVSECIYCGKKKQKEAPALGHNYIATVTEPTATQEGFTTYVCSRCGDTYVGDKVAAKGETSTGGSGTGESGTGGSSTDGSGTDGSGTDGSGSGESGSGTGGTDEIEDTDFTYRVLADGNYEVASYIGTDTSVVIPDTVQGKKVTSIGAYVFSNKCTFITSVTIGNNVTSIGYDAFFGCYKLVEVYNKSSLSITKGSSDYGYVGYYAQAIYTAPYVSKLSTDENGYIIYTDGDDVSLIEYTGDDTELTLPAGITAINQGAFYNYKDITSVTIPNGVTSIGSYAFSGCYKLVEVYNKSSLNITKGSSDYGYVGRYAKAVYTAPYESKLSTDANGYIIYTDGDDVILIGYTGNDTELNLPTGITEIYQYAFFYRDENITSVTIPDSVTSIGDEAFIGCYQLAEVYNKSSLNIIKGSRDYGYVGYYAQAIYTAPYVSKLSTDANGYIIYTDGDDVILIGYTGNDTELNLPTGITEIYQFAFYNNTSITSVTIPEGVTSIGDEAFNSCISLSSVQIPSSVTSIGASAFYHCISLKSIVLPNNVTRIGYGAFAGCTLLTSVTIPNSVTSMGGSAFSGCSNLQCNEYGDAYYLGNSTNSYLVLIKAKTSITDCTINPNTKFIHDGAFSACSALESITIPNTVVSIGDWAIYETCINLTSITYQGSSQELLALEIGYISAAHPDQLMVHCTDVTLSMEDMIIARGG